MVSASEEDDNGNGGSMSSDETAGDFYSEYECVEELGRGLSSGKGLESWSGGYKYGQENKLINLN